MWWFFSSFLFPCFLHSPLLATPMWWANLYSLAPCVCSIHLVFVKLAFHKHTLSLGHQTTDMTTASAAAAAASASSGLHFSLTDGRSQREAVFLSLLLPLLVRINSFRLTWRVSAHQSEPKGVWCVESALDAWQVLRERVEGVVGGRGWGSAHWLMMESSRAPHSRFPPPT